MSKSLFQRHVSDCNPFISYVLSTHLLIEHLLEGSLRLVLPRPEPVLNGRMPSFSMLVDLSEALQVVEPDFATVLRHVNSLRNKYSHRIAFEVGDKEISRLLKSLRDMTNPFFISNVEPSEREMGLALAAIAGHLERRAYELGFQDL